MPSKRLLRIDEVLWRWTRARSPVLRRVWHSINCRRAGRESFRRGGAARLERLRAMAREGGLAAVAADGQDNRAARMRAMASAAGRASWAALSPQEAAEKRRRAGIAANMAVSHERRVEIGRRAMAIRWGRTDAV